MPLNLKGPLREELYRELARHLSLGHDVAETARSMDLQASYLEQLLARPDFEQFFAREAPGAYATWKEARETEEANQVVRHLARKHAPSNYRALQEIADNPPQDMKPSERARILADLLKMSGTVGDEVAVKTVRIAPAHLAALRTAAEEVD